MRLSAACAGVVASSILASVTSLCAVEPARDLGQVLHKENQDNGVTHEPTGIVDDATFLRRIYVDLIGRIPTVAEIDHFATRPAATRRADLVDELMQDERFADTWTVFFADMLRLRSNADGGSAAIAFVHQAVRDEVPYDELARRFIAANGKAGATPEVGFVLGDNADPMALAGATSQVFLGIRVACAQCHDHPFDQWTQHDFYGLAAYFGKTRRMETRFTNTVYTTEASQSSVLWPPEGEGDAAERKPMQPRFPFALEQPSSLPPYIARLEKLRLQQVAKTEPVKKDEVSVDDLLSSLDGKVERVSRGRKKDTLDVSAEAKRDARGLGISSGMASESELRAELARLITDPNNRYFSRCFANRVWATLVGRGIVEPIDDFSDNNPPSHPQTLDFLANEFVASGYNLKSLIRMVVLSEPYQRSHACDVDEMMQAELEGAFLATPMRRMLSEVIYDSVVVAGHLFDVKHAAGQNLKTVWQQTRVAKATSDADGPLVADRTLLNDGAATQMAAADVPAPTGYNLENAIELDFDAVLRKNQKMESSEEVAIDRMQVMSKEELEAMRMQQEARERRNVEYIDRFTRTTVDDNPKFTSSFRMASPAAPEHFLRVFGQTDRTQLGDHRDSSPSMRQALMMLNGRLTHEASRVGALEPVYELLVGEKADLPGAVRLTYREILTRLPDEDELREAKAIIEEADSPTAGMADLRWLLLNCDEFRFLP